MKRLFWLAGLFLWLPQAGWTAASPWQSNPHGQVRLITPYAVAPSTGELWLGLEFKLAPGWHVYWQDAGDSGYPPKITWEGSRGLEKAELLFPEAKKFHLPGNILANAYEDEVVYPIRARRTTAPALHAVANVSYLTCGDICLPYKYTLTLDQAVAEKPQPDPQTAPRFERFLATVGRPPVEAGGEAPAPAGSLAWILLLGWIGGMILNVMPCVLPVLSIKLLGLLQHGGQSRRIVARDSLASAAGILASFLALAAAAIAARSAGHAVGWGIQFQEPLFIAALILILALFALNLWGVFEIHLPSALGRLGAVSREDEGPGSFFVSGLFATLLATPCSAPFLGTAMGFALAQSAATILAMFIAVGLGMAMPYLLLAAFPRTIQWLPRPGAWMLRLRAILGFFLAATVIWLGYVLAHQITAEGQAWFALAILGLSFIVWLREALLEKDRTSRTWRFVFWILGIAAVCAALRLVDISRRPAAAVAAPSGPYAWVPFDEAEIDRLVAKGQWVFVDVTADWCFTCKVNEKTVLNTEPVARALEGVVMMKADWTNRDPAVGRYLEKFGRAGIPFYALYRPGRPPVLLSEFLTTGKVLAALHS